MCDSPGWTVGLASGETNAAEYFGPDCAQRRCPSGDDPHSSADETDCGGAAAPGGKGTGAAGNKCYVECSRRGTCDHATGACTCFAGFGGAACERSATAKPHRPGATGTLPGGGWKAEKPKHKDSAGDVPDSLGAHLELSNLDTVVTSPA